MPLHKENFTEGEHVKHRMPGVELDESDRARFDRLTQALIATDAQTRALITKMRISTEIYQDDGEVANAGDLELDAKPSSNNNVLVKTIVFQGPVGCTTLTLTLGRRVFTFTNPINGGYWPNLELVLRPEEIRKLTWAPIAVGGGDVFLWILGVQLPQVGF